MELTAVLLEVQLESRSHGAADLPPSLEATADRRSLVRLRAEVTARPRRSSKSEVGAQAGQVGGTNRSFDDNRLKSRGKAQPGLEAVQQMNLSPPKSTDLIAFYRERAIVNTSSR
jgi:hypothetical protein